ncbi:MAG: hypothetical protein ACK2UU_08880 [Anaerolineae bacterium]
MRAPHFVQLAAIDERRFINACRHGLVHLTWNRITVRFTRDEFRRLARLLARSVGAPPPTWLRDGEIACTYTAQECNLRLGSLTLVVSPNEYEALSMAAQEAVEQLDKILDAGMWDVPESEEPEETPPGILERFRRHRFSEN